MEANPAEVICRAMQLKPVDVICATAKARMSDVIGTATGDKESRQSGGSPPLT
jgi:hypothetical protein